MNGGLLATNARRTFQRRATAQRHFLEFGLQVRNHLLILGAGDLGFLNPNPSVLAVRLFPLLRQFLLGSPVMFPTPRVDVPLITVCMSLVRNDSTAACNCSTVFELGM